MQRARCYLIGETAVVLELEPPVTLASQKRIWRLAQRLVDMPNVVEAIPGMNNITVILRNPESLALDAIERLQRWWEESEAASRISGVCRNNYTRHGALNRAYSFRQVLSGSAGRRLVFIRWQRRVAGS